MEFRLTELRNFDTVILLGQPQPEQEYKMATRRSNGEGTVWYAKTEGRFRAQYPDANGHRRTITGKTKRDVEKKLRTALTKRDSNTLEEMASIAGTVEELLVSFIESLEGKREPKTIERYALDVNNYLVPTLGKLKLNQLTSDIIEIAYSTIKRDFVLSDNSMAHCHATLRGAIKRGMKHKKVAFLFISLAVFFSAQIIGPTFKADLRGIHSNPDLLQSRLNVEEFISKYPSVPIQKKIYFINQNSTGYEKYVFAYLLPKNEVNYWCWTLGEKYYPQDQWSCNKSLNVALEGYDYLYIFKGDQQLVRNNLGILGDLVGAKNDFRAVFQIKHTASGPKLEKINPISIE